MKLFSTRFCRIVATASLAAVGLLSFPANSAARDWDRDEDDRGRWRDDDRWHRHYSQPRSRWTITFGTGYAGRGYYYGPPGAGYYYNAPGVVYYRTRESVPSRYYVREPYRRSSIEFAVQRALARRGYYYGPIDGDLGPGSRRAIARYQRDHGLRVTGTVTSGLLRSLAI